MDQLHIIGALVLEHFHSPLLPLGLCLDLACPAILSQESPIQSVMLGLKAAFFRSLKNLRCLKSKCRWADPFWTPALTPYTPPAQNWLPGVSLNIISTLQAVPLMQPTWRTSRGWQAKLENLRLDWFQQMHTEFSLCKVKLCYIWVINHKKSEYNCDVVKVPFHMILALGPRPRVSLGATKYLPRALPN